MEYGAFAIQFDHKGLVIFMSCHGLINGFEVLHDLREVTLSVPIKSSVVPESLQHKVPLLLFCCLFCWVYSFNTCSE